MFIFSPCLLLLNPPLIWDFRRDSPCFLIEACLPIRDSKVTIVYYFSIKTNRGSGSGGFTENLFIAAAKELFGEDVNDIQYKILKNSDFQELSLCQDGQTKLSFAIANGFRNIQNLVQKMKRKRCHYDFVEVMACPSGCLNGGAQVNFSLN